MQNKNKKELILEYARAHSLERAGDVEMRAIAAELRRQLGGENKTAPSYIANVLREAGTRVDIKDRYVNPLIAEPYATRLDGLLHFQDLADAESALRKLNEVYQEYRSSSDRAGAALVRSMVIKGKQRAESIARNRRVSPGKRSEKKEIAAWFKVWLDLPDSFFDWLELRKRSEEFQHTFSNSCSEKHAEP